MKNCQRRNLRQGHNKAELHDEEVNAMATKPNIREAQTALDNLKYEVARELGVNLKQGYNGDLSSRENGSVGGYMVKKLIEDYERQSVGMK